ncbi:spondin domain-containing protein [Flavivirga spongiicola]|uniref:Spondin domain-containing protein n=1 Tax=Flavivirga spongiicola TaxID=421621 RepID=A0ABU7XN02_9FLAO|nr:spondin domain-containing protein [Flavivirga sp. MEBiC05379]MDO5981788.1 spondin domain-containing protein [Flavivirga sp. MEBiC05379]
MKKITFLFIFAFLISLTSFGQSTANYTIVFESFWETTAGDSANGISTIPLPGNPHWSPLAIATHKTANTILMMGSPASAGIESIAETGSTSAFESEVTANSDADKFDIGSGLGSAQGTITKSIQISEDHPFVSLATMIAPSPDWFIAVNSENLRSGNGAVNNGWKATYTIDVFPYDAGTEDGSGYSGDNLDTNPLGVITSLENLAPFDGVNSNMSHRIGTVTFNYIESTLSTETINTIENIKIFPNPTKGDITISNIQNSELNSIEVYNVLGNLVKQIEIKTGIPQLSVNLTNLNKGIYLLNLKTIDGASNSKKLVIN